MQLCGGRCVGELAMGSHDDDASALEATLLDFVAQSVAALEAWAARNQPRNGKRVITDAEIIEQAGWAYARDYRGCGCEDPAVRPYCDPRCPLRRPARLGSISRYPDVVCEFHCAT